MPALLQTMNFETNTIELFATDLRSGCTPPLCLSVVDVNSTTGNYPFYVLLDGPHAGIYASWDVVQSCKQKWMVATGCVDQAGALRKWRIKCLQSHEHRNGEDDSFNWLTDGLEWVNAGDLAVRCTHPEQWAPPSPCKASATKPKPSSSPVQSPHKGKSQVSAAVVHYLVETDDGRHFFSDEFAARERYIQGVEKVARPVWCRPPASMRL
ncbi:hypothetical protein C8J56DRAFT_1055466 [Mycena floridula]|nr:hypothetical protein C8J56DRAFT_1055466 [Mycena floridula]